MSQQRLRTLHRGALALHTTRLDLIRRQVRHGSLRAAQRMAACGGGAADYCVRGRCSG